MRDFKMYLKKNWLALTPHLGNEMDKSAKFNVLF
jgi:hypothetical protein